MNEFKKVQVTMSLQINVFFKHSLAPILFTIPVYFL